MATRLALFVFAGLAPLVAASPSRGQTAKPRSLPPSEFLAQSLKSHCLTCHGGQQPKAELSLDKLINKPLTAEQFPEWQLVLAKLARGAMPPEDAPALSAADRERIVVSIKRELRAAGARVDESAWLHPSRGNWVDHDTLFADSAGSTNATRGRLWRLTGRAYEEFVQSLNVKYRLGFRTYGHHRVRSPWELSPHSGFRDYASQHRIGEPEIEHHLRNATRVARAIVARLPKRGGIKELQELLKSDSPTAAEIEAAAAASFDGVLGRPATAEETERYAGFLAGNLKELGAEQAVEQLLIAILFHPEVMYRIELPDADAERALLPPRDLARAIAFALTDREPDAKLLAAAEGRKLNGRADVEQQVARVLADSEIPKPRILRFFQEYFGYTAAIDVFKDSATLKEAGFRGKNDWHPNFFVSDADHLVEWVLAKDKHVLYELLTTTKTFALTGDTKQAMGLKRYPTKPFSLFAQTALDVYEIDIKREQWSDETPFDMPAAHRSGMLTHPSWLIAHSTNFDNHAIHRGRWIRERLLGGTIPDVPVTIDATLPDEPEHTLRERMQVTRDDYCWNCHQYMDPLGLPLEQFDHFGRYRETELDKPVAVTGEILKSGSQPLDGAVKDPFAMMSALAKSKRVEQVFVRHAFRYFLGRNETLADGAVLIEAHRAYAENDGSMNALITALLSSEAFLYRTAAANEIAAAAVKPRSKP
ncbi:MAG: DUF1588 domain-containing protein [Pirellulaceae bacterium]|jgi:hypothetical protein|nr:DUF1588 domain-containing protein [Pirellulaceae bacterium]